MNKLFIILSLFASILFAQEKGYIDMHGGKSDSLSGKGGFSSSMNMMDNPFAKKTDNQHIPIEKIETIKEEKKKATKEYK